MQTKQRIGLVGILAILAGVLFTSCAPTTTETVQNDASRTGIADQLKSTGEYTGLKLRVGVVNFQNKTASRNIGIGESAADILATILQKTDRFIVIPRQDMDTVMKQEASGASASIDPATAAKMGKLLGLNAVVTGAITAYAEAEEEQDYMVYEEKKQIARVTVVYRLVDTTTGIQLLADSEQGVYGKATGGSLGMGSKSNYNPDLRDGALRDALTKAMVNMLGQFAAKEWNGRIADVKGNMVYINAGQKTGLKVGDVLLVQELGEDIIDPQTGVSLGKAPGRIKGEVIVTGFFGNDASVASVRSGSGFKRNDLVKFKR